MAGRVGEHGAPVRRSAPAETARLLADLVAAGARVMAFVRSRHGAEQTAMSARRRLGDIAPHLVDRVESYRGGYLPEERRELEAALNSGELLGVATTNALELGVDIAGIDVAILAGYPGTLASMWQQAGRAGRGHRPALVVFVAREDPLDSYLVHHPEAMFGRPIEAAITDPTNPYLLRPHLACAASEHHLSIDDLENFGGPAARRCVDELVADGVLKVRPAGWYFAGLLHPADEIDLRSGGSGQIVIVENDSARMLGTVDTGRAPSTVHPGAVYLHRGTSYVVDSLDLDEQLALVHEEAPDYSTVARSISSVDLLEVEHERLLAGGIRCGFSRVQVSQQVVGYLRRRSSGELIDQIPLDMPEHCLDTRAVWYTIPAQTLSAAGLVDAATPGALHAAEHAAIGLLPLFGGCDRWDIGGLSTSLHPDTGEPTVIVYDGYPGGAGFAERGFQSLGGWLSAVADAVASCPCQSGCPSCVHSPKCGNRNEPLNKAGALVVLQLMSGALSSADEGG
jgi:DEAD/DEAH box helicase domain-containing protein